MQNKTPRSEAQINASRINGARSKGPVTAAGKAASSANSLLHGLTARSVVLGHEDPEKFEALLTETIHEFAPVTAMELMTVEQLAVLTWKMRRLWSVEVATFGRGLDQQPGHEPDQAYHANQVRLDNLHQQEARLNRLFNRTLACYHQLQARRHRPAPLSAAAPAAPGSPAEFFPENEPGNLEVQ